jgi:hypothetical protein
VRRRIILAVTIAAALFGVVAAPALAQKPESAPAAAALMKSKPKTPAGGTVTVKVTNWREADLAELQMVESGSANWKKVLGALGLARRRAELCGELGDGVRKAA